MTSRRQFMHLGAISALAPGYAFAQVRRPKVGMFGSIPLAKSALSPLVLRGLAELGYKDGTGMQLEYRYAQGAADRYLAVARELIALKCDVIFAIGNEPPARALRDAGTTIPVILVANDYDPVASGIIASLRRPGGNMTGVFAPTGELAAKRLEIAQEMLPGKKRFLVLADRYTRDQLAALRKAAEGRAELTVIEYAREPYDLETAFDAGRRANVDGFLGLSSPAFLVHREKLSALISSNRMPAVASPFMSQQPGVLATYSYDVAKFTRRAAEMGVRVLKGAKPAEMPIEQPIDFEFFVNLRTAKALGINVPYSVLARATKVVE
jgi:putative tryptophan/tyrosine transport system substrate-binding protein